MRSRRRLFSIFFPCAVLAISLTFFLWHEREPSYQGRSLSQWLAYVRSDGTVSHTDFLKAEDAVRQIGTNAIPYLLKWLPQIEPKWKSQSRRAFNELLRKIGREAWRLEDRGVTRAQLAVRGFEILGPAAENAIPELWRKINARQDEDLLYQSTHCLSLLGSKAVTPLTALLTNQELNIRRCAATFLQDLGTDAVPAISALLTNKDEGVRDAATNALLTIAPEALTNAIPR